MQSGFVYILQSLIELYLTVVVLRLGMQWVRADYRNPLVDFVVKVTDPLIKPLQRVLPTVYKLDTATLVVYLGLHWLTLIVLVTLSTQAPPDLLTLLGFAVMRAARQVLNVYFFIILGYVIFSWIAGAGAASNPSLAALGALLRQLAEPIMRPVQSIIPPIGGLDLSPVFVLILLQGAMRALG